METLLTPAVLIELIKIFGAIIPAVIPILYQGITNSRNNHPKERPDKNSGRESGRWRIVIIIQQEFSC